MVRARGLRGPLMVGEITLSGEIRTCLKMLGWEQRDGCLVLVFDPKARGLRESLLRTGHVHA